MDANGEDRIIGGPACACLNVEYMPEVDEETGLGRDRWKCKLCGSEFAKKIVLDNFVEQVQLLQEENEMQEEYIRSLEGEMEDLDALLDQYREVGS